MHGSPGAQAESTCPACPPARLPPTHCSPEVTATTWPLSRTAASTSANSRKSFTVVLRISSLHHHHHRRCEEYSQCVGAQRGSGRLHQQAVATAGPQRPLQHPQPARHTHLRCWRSSSVMPRMWRMKAVRPLESAAVGSIQPAASVAMQAPRCTGLGSPRCQGKAELMWARPASA